MSEKSVAEKAHVKPGAKVAVLNPVPGVVESLGLPSDSVHVEPEQADLVMLFVNDRAGLEQMMPPAVATLGASSALWVFYRKGGKAAGLDMSRDTVWAVAEKLDMRPLGIVGVDEAWSVFRLRKS